MTTKKIPQAGKPGAKKKKDDKINYRTPSPLSSPLQAALNYQAIGLSVIPIRPGPAKKPYVEWKQYQGKCATLEEIKEWWGKWPKANVGIVTGWISGVIVIDIDGPEGQEAFFAEFGEIPATISQRTGREGGLHLLFKHPGNGIYQTKTKILPGVDVRADGGFIVAAPSIHANGKQYEWLIDPVEMGLDDLLDLPEDLKKLLPIKTEDEKSLKNPKGWEFEALAGVEKGQRNNTCARLAGKYLREFSGDLDQAWLMLKGWNERNLPPLPEKEVQRTLQSVAKLHADSTTSKAETQDENTEKSSFYSAKKQYPRTGFPWDVLPVPIADSLKQLARSCATSPTSLPSAAISIFASTVGSTVNVYPKKSWREPLIFWCGDIRPSGEGKTPGPRALCNVLYEAQQMANEVYKMELEAWDLLPKNKRGKPPDKPRGYFVTDLTLEGLRSDHSGHGGKVCVLDELSSFLTSQNQYKKKGSDRESWLCLHDGHPARTVRAKETINLDGCRISVFGGIQPGIWQKIFSEGDGFYLVDGTIYRFLPTYEGSSFYPLTRESWSDENRKAWESLLKNALSWADANTESGELILSEDAQTVFFDWRNDLFQTKDDLPAQIQGFIPKLVGYALRLAGVLYLMHMFSQGQEIGGIINRDYIEKGMRVSEFYLGHIICAIEALAGDASSPLEFTEQVIHLAETLESIETDLDSGRLAIGYVYKKFNETCRPELRVKTPKAMGALLRKCKLTVTDSRFNANGKRGVKCLQWDEKTNSFIESCPPCPPSPPAKEYQGLQPADIEKLKSAMSAGIDIKESKKRTLRTLKNQCPQLETGSMINKADIADLADDFSKEKEKKSFEPMGLPTEMEALPKDYQEREVLEI
jgi:hypothetical protein